VRRVLVDSGPLVAIFSARDQFHVACVEALRRFPVPLLTCWPVLTEAAWLLRNQPAAVERLLAGLNEGLLALLPLEGDAAPGMIQFLARYRKLGAQLADAALVHIAGRENIHTIFTTDRRDFTVYRTSAGRRLKIVPA
jgi:uncharacterized protein